MIGESILATPLLKNHELGKMDVYLPKGVWYDYENGKKYQGPTTLDDFEIPLDKTPCFVGGKGVIVLMDSDDTPLKVKIYPIAEREIAFSFTYPDNKGKSNITYKKWQSAEGLGVQDLTLHEEVTFERDEITGAISFDILPNHDYHLAVLNN